MSCKDIIILFVLTIGLPLCVFACNNTPVPPPPPVDYEFEQRVQECMVNSINLAYGWGELRSPMSPEENKKFEEHCVGELITKYSHKRRCWTFWSKPETFVADVAARNLRGSKAKTNFPLPPPSHLPPYHNLQFNERPNPNYSFVDQQMFMPPRQQTAALPSHRHPVVPDDCHSDCDSSSSVVDDMDCENIASWSFKKLLPFDMELLVQQTN
nr:ethylene-responsive transcription factor 3-like [Ipomoea batatas]